MRISDGHHMHNMFTVSSLPLSSRQKLNGMRVAGRNQVKLPFLTSIPSPLGSEELSQFNWLWHDIDMTTLSFIPYHDEISYETHYTCTADVCMVHSTAIIC